MQLYISWYIFFIMNFRCIRKNKIKSWEKLVSNGTIILITHQVINYNSIFWVSDHSIIVDSIKSNTMMTITKNDSIYILFETLIYKCLQRMASYFIYFSWIYIIYIYLMRAIHLVMLHNLNFKIVKIYEKIYVDESANHFFLFLAYILIW